MKKTIKLAFLFVIIGFIIGDYIFTEQKEIINSLSNKETLYFLEEGVYLNKNNLQANIKNLEEKVIENTNSKYYVYVGITRDKEVATKLKKIYKSLGYEIKEKEKSIHHEDFITNVEQFDILLKDTNDTEQILTIEEIVLSNYEEILKKSSKT